MTDQITKNIKFVGRKTFGPGKHKVLDDPQPIERISEGGEIIELPSSEFQKTRRLFYHSDAAKIVRLFPHLYKTVKSK